MLLQLSYSFQEIPLLFFQGCGSGSGCFGRIRIQNLKMFGSGFFRKDGSSLNTKMKYLSLKSHCIEKEKLMLFQAYPDPVLSRWSDPDPSDIYPDPQPQFCHLRRYLFLQTIIRLIMPFIWTLHANLNSFSCCMFEKS